MLVGLADEVTDVLLNTVCLEDDCTCEELEEACCCEVIGGDLEDEKEVDVGVSEGKGEDLAELVGAREVFDELGGIFDAEVLPSFPSPSL